MKMSYVCRCKYCKLPHVLFSFSLRKKKTNFFFLSHCLLLNLSHKWLCVEANAIKYAWVETDEAMSMPWNGVWEAEKWKKRNEKEKNIICRGEWANSPFLCSDTTLSSIFVAVYVFASFSFMAVICLKNSYNLAVVKIVSSVKRWQADMRSDNEKKNEEKKEISSLRAHRS